MYKSAGKTTKRDLGTLIRQIKTDWASLTQHIQELCKLLLAKKKTLIAVRVGMAVLCVVALLLIRAGDYFPIGGDEPHYLLMDYSLVHDHDLNLANNFSHKDYEKFDPYGLTPYRQVGPNQYQSTTKQYSIHGAGVALLTLPGFIAGGAYGVRVEMILIAVTVLYLVYYWSKRVTGSAGASLTAAAILFVSFMYAGLAGYVFPDMVQAAIIVAALILLTKNPYSRKSQALLGLLLGFGLLVHVKMLTFVAFTTLFLCYKTWKHNKKLPYVMLITLVLIMAAFVFKTHQWFGVWNPSAAYTSIGNNLSVSRPAFVIPAALFDAGLGILANCPALILLFVGFPIWLRKQRETFWMTITCIAASLAVLVSFNDWNGAYAPTGRYLMEFLPVLMPAVAFAIKYMRDVWQRLLILGLFMVTAIISVYYSSIHRGWFVTDSPIRFFNFIFPNFNETTARVTGKHDWLKVGFYYVVLIGLALYGWNRSAKPQPKIFRKSVA